MGLGVNIKVIKSIRLHWSRRWSNLKKMIVKMHIKLIFLMFFSFGASAASFDCAKTTTKNETLICSDQELSGLDSQLAVAYSDALKLPANDPKILKDEQKLWLKNLRINATQETDANKIGYLKATYTSRISVLRKNFSNEAELESEATYVRFQVQDGEVCNDAVTFSSVGKLDFGQDAVGAYQSFFDGSTIIRIGFYAEMNKKDGDMLQSLAENSADVKIKATVCPKSKDKNGVSYLRQGSWLSVFPK